MGTPRDLAEYDSGTDETTVANHRRYDSYGVLISETDAGVALAFGFTGVFFDDYTGLSYHRARWLDLHTGRWMSEDPIGFDGNDENLARYVGNSPTDAIDPTGHVEYLDADGKVIVVRGPDGSIRIGGAIYARPRMHDELGNFIGYKPYEVLVTPNAAEVSLYNYLHSSNPIYGNDPLLKHAEESGMLGAVCYGMNHPQEQSIWLYENFTGGFVMQMGAPELAPSMGPRPRLESQILRKPLDILGQIHADETGSIILSVEPGVRIRGPKLPRQQGREFRIDQLELFEFDENIPSHVRGWLRNERLRVEQGRTSYPRTPPGYELGHGRSTPAREGYDYSNARLQSCELNKLEETVRRRAGRP